MATEAAKQLMLERQLRRSRILAENYGTPGEVEKFNETINQPTYGEQGIFEVNLLTAVNDMWEHISGHEVSEEELMEEEKIYEAPAPGEDEPQEWQASHLSPESQGQGQISDEVAEAVRKGDAEGQQADTETQNLDTEEAQGEGDIGTDEPTATDEKPKGTSRSSSKK